MASIRPYLGSKVIYILEPKAITTFMYADVYNCTHKSGPNPGLGAYNLINLPASL